MTKTAMGKSMLLFHKDGVASVTNIQKKDLFFFENISSLSSLLLPAGYNIKPSEEECNHKKCTEDYTNNSE